jgi:hypothetical protein
MDPTRTPDPTGEKVTENEQLPAAGTLFPQSFVSLKSLLLVIDEMVSGPLPILRSKTLWGWLLEPTTRLLNCKEAGLSETAGAASVPIFRINTSVLPPNCFWNADGVIGKSVEFVNPAT